MDDNVSFSLALSEDASLAQTASMPSQVFSGGDSSQEISQGTQASAQDPHLPPAQSKASAAAPLAHPRMSAAAPLAQPRGSAAAPRSIAAPYIAPSTTTAITTFTTTPAQRHVAVALTQHTSTSIEARMREFCIDAGRIYHTKATLCVIPQKIGGTSIWQIREVEPGRLKLKISALRMGGVADELSRIRSPLGRWDDALH